MRRRSLSLLLCPRGLRTWASLTVATMIAACGLLAAPPASGQTAVQAIPPSYITYNNVTGAVQATGTISYSAASNSYVAAAPQLPNRQYSYVALSGGTYLDSTVSTLRNMAVPAADRQLINATLPAGVANTSFGGLLLGRQWNSVDVVMTQCFSGGFAFNVQGSLMGNAAAAAPANHPVVGYTFTSSANFNEVSFGRVLPSQKSGTDANNLAVGDYTQGWARSAAGGSSMLTNYLTGGLRQDPYVVNGNAPGVPNQVTIGAHIMGQPAGANNVTSLGFESPVYASSDPLANILGTKVVNPFAPNNSRSLGTATAAGASTRWAVLMAFSPNDRSDFILDIDREYAALRAQGVPANHIAVLFGNMGGGTLPLAPNILAANNVPNINQIPNAAGGFITAVPVTGSTSLANITALLSGGALWANKGLAQPPAAATSNLLVYTTGHGNAEASGGMNIVIPNARAGPGDFTNLLKIGGPDNFNGDVMLQLAAARALPNLQNDMISVNGHALGAATLVSAAQGTAFDISNILGPPTSVPPFYYDVILPASDYLSTGGLDSFSLSVTSSSLSDILAFDSNIEGLTIIDDTSMADISAGAVDTYTDLLATPEPSAWVLLGIGMSGVLLYFCWQRRKRAVGAAISAAAKRSPASMIL